MRINALGNTATDFASDDYIALDGATNSSRKMKNDSLLKVTAQNALAGNVAPAFDPTRTISNPYKAGESVTYEGKTYTFNVDHYGAWNVGHVVDGSASSLSFLEFSKNILNTKNAEFSIYDVTIKESKDGKFVFSGISSVSGGRLSYVTDELYLEAGTYWFRAKSLNSYSFTNRLYLSAFIQYGSGTTIPDATLNSCEKAVKFTLSEPRSVRLGFNLVKGRVYSNFSFELSLYRNVLGNKQNANENSIVDFVARKDFEECSYVTSYYIPDGVNIVQGATIDTESPVNNGNYNYYIVEVKKGDLYLLLGTGADAARLWAFLDTNKKLVVNSDKGVSVTDFILEAPIDGFLVVNVRNNQNYSLKKLLRSSFISYFVESKKKYFDFLLERNYAVCYANAPKPLNFLNYTGTKDTTHPKVLYFALGLFGHKYWMAYTPYPNGNDDFENPCIGYSDDGFLWYGIAANPLDVPSDVGTGGFNSDVHLLYNATTGKLECWWRYVTEIGGNRVVNYYRLVSSDGLTWTDKELMRTINNTAKDLSPVVMWNGSKYLIWTVDAGEHNIVYYETNDGTNWVEIRRIELQYSFENETFNPWHIDVEFFDGKYHIIVSTKSSTTTRWILFRSESSDNVTYSVPEPLVLDNNGNWDNQLYRSCIVKISDEEYRLYYSARNGGNNGVGLSIAHKYPLFIGCDRTF